MHTARMEDLSIVMKLDRLFLGELQAVLCMEKFEMTYREYLRNHRDSRHLKEVLRFVL